MAIAQYPGAISTQLFKAVARKSTTLTSDITSATTPLPVASSTGFTTEGFVVIENETIYYKGTTATNLGTTTCTRGFDGTAVAHVSGKDVKLSIVAENWNIILAELLETQRYIGASGTTYTSSLAYIVARSNYLGTSTEGQLNVGYLGGSTNRQLNPEQVDSIRGITLAENSIVFTPDAFNLDNNSPATLSETDGTSIAPKRKFVLFAKTEQADLTQFLMPRVYDGKSVTAGLLVSCQTASQSYRFGLKFLIAGSGDAYNGNYGDAQYFDADTSSATSNAMKLITKEFSQTQTSFVVNKLTNIQVYRDDSGDTAEQRIHNFRIRFSKG